MTLTRDQLEIITHTQRPDQGRLKGIFVTDCASKDYLNCLHMVANDYMLNRGTHPFCNDTIFIVTPKGLQAVRLASD